MKNKILLLPGWMTSLKLYKNDSSDFYVDRGKLNEKSLSADYIIGISLGALGVLKDIKKIKGRIILINPLLPKRSILNWFVRWMKYITNEGLFLKRQKFTLSPIRYIAEIVNCIKLLNIDFSKTLDIISKDKITVIRATNDRFFCDTSAVDFLRSKGVKVVEIEGGHNWSEEIEKTMNNLII